MPVYLLNWNIIPNYNIHSHDTRKATNIHTSMTRHEFAKKCLKYNLPHIINDTPELVMEKIVTHSLRGFAYYLKIYLKTYVQYLIVTYVSLIHKIIRILTYMYMDRCNEMLYTPVCILFIVT